MRAAGHSPDTSSAPKTAQSIQDALIWTGHYKGRVDGKLGARSRAAIAEFQERNGWLADGKLCPDQLKLLFDESERRRRSVGFDIFHEPRSRIKIGLPSSLGVRSSTTDRGHRYVFYGNMEIVIARFRPADRTFWDLYKGAVDDRRGQLTSNIRTEIQFFVSAQSDDTAFIYTARRDGADTLYLSIFYPMISKPELDHIVIAISNSFHLSSKPGGSQQ